MNEGTKKYIQTRIPGAWFSETLYLSNFGAAAAMLDFRQQGAVLILVSTLSLQVPAGAGIVTITDNFGRVMFNAAQQVENSGDYSRSHIIQAGFILISTSIPVVNFTVGFQYITYPDKYTE